MSAATAKASAAQLVKGGQVLEHFPFKVLELGESAAVIGVSQNGKTTWAMGWAAAMVALGIDVIAWDPCWEWGQDAKKRLRAKPGPLARTVTVAELEADPDPLLNRNGVSLAVRPTDIYAPRKEIAQQFHRFVYLVRSLWPIARLKLFIDEVNILKDYAAEDLDDLSERGGKDGLIPIFVGQRWSHLTANMRAEIAWLISFLQSKESDLTFLRLDAGSPFARAVCALEPYQYRAIRIRGAHAEALERAGISPAVHPNEGAQ